MFVHTQRAIVRVYPARLARRRLSLIVIEPYPVVIRPALFLAIGVTFVLASTILGFGWLGVASHVSRVTDIAAAPPDARDQRHSAMEVLH